MRRMIHMLTAVCAVLLLPGCSSREVLVTKAVNLGFKIERVTGSKVIFSVNPDNEDACYIYCCQSEGHPQFELSDLEAARNYIAYVEGLSEQWPEGKEPIGGFPDNFCYRGSRKLKLDHLSSNTLFRILLFQVNPKTHAIIGDVISELVRTREVSLTPMSFDISSKNKTIIISPSEPDRTYFWCFDRTDRIIDDYGNPFFFLYSMLDMYEEYGFAEHVLSKGDVLYNLPNELWEDEEYCVCAIAYENGEITSEDTEWYFFCQKGMITEVRY